MEVRGCLLGWEAMDGGAEVIASVYIRNRFDELK